MLTDVSDRICVQLLTTLRTFRALLRVKGHELHSFNRCLSAPCLPLEVTPSAALAVRDMFGFTGKTA